MNTSTSKIVMIIAAVACVGCCAIPLYAIVAGVSGIALLAALMSEKNMEVLMCLVPLLLAVMGYYVYQRKNRKACCTSPKRKCSSAHCNINQGDHQ